MRVSSVVVTYYEQGRLIASRKLTYDGRVLRIPLPPGPPVLRAAIWYHGSPQDGLIIGPNAHGRRVVFADNWPERARFWVPTVDQPHDKARTWVLVEAPAGWRVVANGASSPNWGNHWDEMHPIPVYTMVIGAGEFTVSKHRPV